MTQSGPAGKDPSGSRSRTGFGVVWLCGGSIWYGGVEMAANTQSHDTGPMRGPMTGNETYSDRVHQQAVATPDV